jgi:hypothetical protein
MGTVRKWNILYSPIHREVIKNYMKINSKIRRYRIKLLMQWVKNWVFYILMFDLFNYDK